MTAPPAPLAQPRRHLPRGEDFLLFPPSIQPYGYRIVDKLFAHRVEPTGRSSRREARRPADR